MPKSHNRYGKYAQTWPLLNRLIWDKIRRPCLRGTCLIEVQLHENSFGGNVKWPFKTGACLTEVVASAGGTVMLMHEIHQFVRKQNSDNFQVP